MAGLTPQQHLSTLLALVARVFEKRSLSDWSRCQVGSSRSVGEGRRGAVVPPVRGEVALKVLWWWAGEVNGHAESQQQHYSQDSQSSPQH